MAVCVAGLVLAHHAMVLSGFALTQNDLGDTRLEHYLMEHAWRWLTGWPAHRDYWSPPYFAPVVGHLAWSDTMAAAAVFYVPFRAAMDPHDAFQAWAANRRDIAAAARAVGPDCRAFAMSPVRGHAPYWKYQLGAMWGAMEAGVPTINGYSGQGPPGWGLTDTNLRDESDEARMNEALERWIRSHAALRDQKVCWVRLNLDDGANVGANGPSFGRGVERGQRS